jgi:hypothetical protein
VQASPDEVKCGFDESKAPKHYAWRILFLWSRYNHAIMILVPVADGNSKVEKYCTHNNMEEIMPLQFIERKLLRLLCSVDQV